MILPRATFHEQKGPEMYGQELLASAACCCSDHEVPGPAGPSARYPGSNFRRSCLPAVPSPGERLVRQPWVEPVGPWSAARGHWRSNSGRARTTAWRETPSWRAASAGECRWRTINGNGAYPALPELVTVALRLGGGTASHRILQYCPGSDRRIVLPAGQRAPHIIYIQPEYRLGTTDLHVHSASMLGSRRSLLCLRHDGATW
jgi:hypothetical protein